LYINTFNEAGLIESYMKNIENLCRELKIEQFFDFGKLGPMAKTNNNLDSLLFISINSFDEMNNHLYKNNRTYISTLIVLGCWIEGFYKLTTITKANQQSELISLIGEQMIILNDLIFIFEKYGNNKYMNNLTRDLKEIKKIYDGDF
jgi:hypothetical protein